MGLEKLIESRIQDAIAAGHFEGLKGAGRPLAVDNQEQRLAGENWLGFKVLQNGDLLPEWLALAREIEVATEALRGLEQRFADWAWLASSSGRWEQHAPGLRYLRRTILERARALRAMQDRFNVGAPSISLERPGVWVEYLAEQLDARLCAAGAPGWLVRAEPTPGGSPV
jgi:hypothetical protein